METLIKNKILLLEGLSQLASSLREYIVDQGCMYNRLAVIKHPEKYPLNYTFA